VGHHEGPLHPQSRVLCLLIRPDLILLLLSTIPEGREEVSVLELEKFLGLLFPASTQSFEIRNHEEGKVLPLQRP
jgi:hypothetical protein